MAERIQVTDQLYDEKEELEKKKDDPTASETSRKSILWQEKSWEKLILGIRKNAGKTEERKNEGLHKGGIPS